ncbi:hypothetical protein O9993_16135 [Vibrio lentus]|nr:hypothetical protein [Vibrio lentus]
MRGQGRTAQGKVLRKPTRRGSQRDGVACGHGKFHPPQPVRAKMLEDALPELEARLSNSVIVKQQTAFLEQAQSKISQPESALRYARWR